MTTLTAEAIEARLAQLESTLQVLREENLQLHAQIQALEGRPAHREFQLLDPKTMVPDIFGANGGPTWKTWSHKTKAFIGMLNAPLSKYLTSIEQLDEPITQHQYDEARIPPSHEAQISRLLLLRTDGTPHLIVKGAQAQELTSLETWRLLSAEFDPKGLGSDLMELQELTTPEKLRARNVAGISAAIQAWEELERRHREREGLVLPEKLRISVLLKLVPSEVAKDIISQPTRWTKYLQLKDHLHKLQFCRTNGPAPMLMNLNDEPIDSYSTEIVLEDGEILKLERRDGRQVAVRTGKREFKSGPRDKNKLECFRCGRLGHTRPHCTATKHKDGGPCRPKPPPKTMTNNIEERTATEGEPRQIGHLELNALDIDSSEPPVATQPSRGRQILLDQLVKENELWMESLRDQDAEEPSTEEIVENMAAAQATSGEDPWGSPEHDPWSNWGDDSARVPLAPMPRTPPKPPVRSALESSITPEMMRMPITELWKLITPPCQPPDEVMEWDPDVATDSSIMTAATTAVTPAPTSSTQNVDACTQTSAIETVSRGTQTDDGGSDGVVPVLAQDHAETQTESIQCSSFGVQTDIDLISCRLSPNIDDSRLTFGQPPKSTDEEMIYYDAEEHSEASSMQDLLMVDLDLGAVTAKPGYKEIKVTMDSGAAEPVSSPDSFPGAEVVPSPGSEAGQIYLGPGKEEIPNEGQFKPTVTLEDGGSGTFTFQAARVRKPLMAVSSVNDKGHLVLFDLEGSFLIPAQAPEVAMIRELVAQAQGKVTLHRENGIFNMRVWQKSSDFARQGK